MSIEANTYEELYINNVNEKTADLASQVSKYLIETWGIINLELTADGVVYSSTEERIEEGTEIYGICMNLVNAKEILLSLRSVNNGGAWWRIESSFMGALTDDEKLKNNVTYKSTDYYDTDSYIDMYRYDEDGMSQLDYDGLFEDIADIEKWFCYTPEFVFTTEETDNTELYEKVINALKAFSEELEEYDFEDLIDDWFEDSGKIYMNGSLSFATESISEIEEIFGELSEELNGYEDVEFEVKIVAVPEGENDYNFASVSISVENGEVQTKYCRF